MSLYLGSQKVTPTIPAPPSDITITSLDVEANGTYNAPSLTAYSTVNVNVPAIDPPVSDAVRFFDYDGTILYTYTAAQFLALSTMPANPSHTGLVAQGWNWTLEDAQDYVEEWECLDIGQVYTTASGATEIDIKLQKGRLSPYLSLAVNGTVNVDWGDGSSIETITGTSTGTAIRTPHTYSTPGEYTIKITIVNGSLSLLSSSSYVSILNANISASNSLNRHYSAAIQAIRIGNGNISLGGYATYYCANLKYITIPNTIVSVSANTLFQYCSHLKIVIYPLSSTNLSIYSNNFQYDYNLIAILFSKSVTSISGVTCSNCFRLKSVCIPPNVLVASGVYVTPTILSTMSRYIEPKRNLKIVKTHDYDIDDVLSGNSIDSYQFAYVTTLKQATIPANITTISSSAFERCERLESVSFPSNISFSGNGHFGYCYSMQSFTFPSNMTSIPDYFCREWRSYMPEITLPSNVTTLGTYAFDNNNSLSSIKLPSSLTTLGNSFCSYAYCLQEISLPSTLQTMGTYCFRDCYYLTELTIPASVTSIGNYSFYYCYGLKEIHVKSTNPPTLGGTSVFYGLPSDCTIYVPTASLSTYQSASNWSTFASQMVGE